MSAVFVSLVASVGDAVGPSVPDAISTMDCADLVPSLWESSDNERARPCAQVCKVTAEGLREKHLCSNGGGEKYGED